MKSFLSLSIVMLLTLSFVYSQQSAPLGKLLTKKIESMKDADQTLVLISFKDKGSQSLAATSARALLTERAITRREKVKSKSSIIDQEDLPLEQSYVNEIARLGIQIRHQLKWFNAVSGFATKSQIELIRLLPFVQEIEIVGRWQVTNELEKETPDNGIAPEANLLSTDSISYGASITQLAQLNVPAVHNMGIYGQGIIVGVFDNGVRLPGHEAFANISILATHDFVDHKVSVVPNNPSTDFGSHGVNTLSTIGGYKPGQLIGPAFGATFILARTENDSSETPVEEDNWAKAIEWADSLGVDVTSTSLGYLTYDSPYPSWTWQDMDGNTTLITRAADRAVGLGITVLNSAGNSGSGTHNTLGAPADGDSVISVGAVDASGSRVSFSSVGPTTDTPPRIKPDIMAMGSGVRVASSTSTTGYGSASGTSFSCPLSAGVAALVLSANPSLTPIQVREALRQTANNAASPNNLNGWGIINARNAIGYYGFDPSIRGVVFNDNDVDGIKDTNETGIAGVLVKITGTKTDSVYTDSGGNYFFDSLSVGSFTVSISGLPSGAIIRFPSNGYYSLTIDSSHMAYAGKNFSVVGSSSIAGTVFEDINDNGVKDSGEPFASSWKLKLTGTDSRTTQTDSNGVFLFDSLAGGSYTLAESLQTGWAQSAPAANFSFSLAWGQHATGYTFGVYRLGSISGLVFSDDNYNGILDSNETGISGWKIQITGTANASTISDANGHYKISNLSPGSYTVSESLQTSWTQTLPPSGGNYSFVLNEGNDTSNINFGNYYTPHASYSIAPGWNLLSLPLHTDDHSLQTLYPTALSEAFTFNAQEKYLLSDTIPEGLGYWLKFGSSQNIMLSGSIKTADTVSVHKGWNMISSLSDPVQISGIISQPDSLVSSNYYSFANGYSSSTTLLPHYGYWVKAKDDGVLLLHSTLAKKHKAQRKATSVHPH